MLDVYYLILIFYLIICYYNCIDIYQFYEQFEFNPSSYEKQLHQKNKFND